MQRAVFPYMPARPTGSMGGPHSRLRRFTYRLDGFVSVRASGLGGEVVTKPLTFSGSKLAINFATNVQGSVRVEIQEVEGRPINGLTHQSRGSASPGTR
jgi:hypothetical protein